MKTRALIIAVLGLTMSQAWDANAFQHPEQPQLPNYDQRKQQPTVAAASSSVQDDAAVALESRVPTLRLVKHATLRTPRLLSAQRGFLTGVGGQGKGLDPASLETVPAGDPHRIVKAFVNEHSALFGHDARAFDSARVKTDYVTPHNGLRTVIWQQILDGVPVYGGLFVSHLTRREELAAVSDRFVPDLAAASSALPDRSSLVSSPPLTALESIQRAAENLGQEINASDIEALETGSIGVEKRQDYGSSELRGPAHTQLVWLPLNASSLRLCWQIILTARSRPEMYLILVDAETGEVRLRHCLTSYISDASYNVYTSDSPSPFSPGLSVPGTFQPTNVLRQLVTLPALNTNASPAGWINDGGNETRGNNVDAHLDRDDNNAPDLPRPQGNPNRVFDFPLDLNLPPNSYGNASVVNLFYWNNFAHDKLYELGFTEAAGNFQVDNFGRGGFGNDAVLADGQDGGGFNNANFATPPDGFPGRMQMYLFSGPTPDRDGSLDAEVMLHEYVHGLSNRLLGGGGGIFELQPAGMGEGWSDFYAMALLSEGTDDPRANYATGGYLTLDFFGLTENYYFGIRRYPYTTDLNKNPLTLKDIDPTQADSHPGVPISPVIGGGPADEVHNQGEVWCVALWEARANLIDKLGFTLGNQTILQLVTDGMKLAPDNATFLEARDGILLADEILTGGDNLAELWVAFAKRGMGYTATVPTADTTIGVREAYDLPPFIVVTPPDGIMEINVAPAPFSALFGGTTNLINVRITDGSSNGVTLAVTDANIAASLSIGGTLVFINDGTPPDLTASNAIYTASFVTPNTTTNITLTLVITAPGKDPSTNNLNYDIIAIPTNDDFADAAKVPAGGAVYISNNQLATLEPGEPAHAGLFSAVGSLWWNFTPATNSSVLVDTAGSLVNTVVAVYTNNALTTLQSVVSADDVGTRQLAFVTFNARTGVTYRIAIAGADSGNTGTLRLAVTPGGIPDTNPPSVTVSSPLSGITVATNRILLTGTAIDPDPNPSGLREIRIIVNPDSLGTADGGGGTGGSGGSGSSLISTNWTRTVGLFEGLNFLEVSITDVAGNLSAPVTLQVTYRPQDPPNDIFANALQLTAMPELAVVNTLRATKELGEPDHAGNPGGKSAWWRFQPPADGMLQLTTTNSTFDTLLAVYTGSSVSQLTLVAANDDAYDGAPDGFSSLALAVKSNQVYRIVVDGYDAASGVVFLGYEFTPVAVYRLTVNNTVGGVVSPSAVDVVSNSTVSVLAVPNPEFRFDNWDGDVVSSANPLSVVVNGDLSITAHFVPVIHSDGFESGGLSALGWTSGGNAPWIVQTNVVAAGSFAARSGVIGDGQTSSLFLSGDYPAGNVSFALRVSSESGWDFLKFLSDGVLVQQWSGDIGWTIFSHPVAAGPHTFEWRYAKDANEAFGLDAAFIDNLDLPVATPVVPTFRLTNVGLGSFTVEVTGDINQLFYIQASSDLISWQTISTNSWTGSSIQFTDPAAPGYTWRYYRVFGPH
jgi:hypothetical protein